MLAALRGLISQRGEASPAHLDQGAGLETICFGVRLPPVSPHPSRPAESEYSHCSWSNSARSIQQHVLSAPYLIEFFFAFFFLRASPEEDDSAQAHGCGGVQTGIKKNVV